MTTQPATTAAVEDPGQRHAQATAAVAALTAALTLPLAQAWGRLRAAVDRITVTWLDEPPTVRARRARALAASAAVEIGIIEADVDADVDHAVRDVFTASAAAAAADVGVAWALTRADRVVLDRLAADLTADLRQAIAYTSTTARALARQIERLATIDGPHTAQAAALARALEDRGLAAVVYRDGSRHGLDDYARMATRTKLAQTWQLAGLRLMSSVGVTYVEIADGQSCGWTSHTDPDKADGKILPIDEALAYPLAHPRCVRTSYPRTDVRSGDEAAVAPRLGRGGSLADGGGDAPAVRDSAGLLDVRSSALLSPAAGRHAASVARALGRVVGAGVPVVGVARARQRSQVPPATGPGQR